MNIEKALKEMTAYETLEEFANNTPTLRLDKNVCDTLSKFIAMKNLRHLWESETGKKAFPQYSNEQYDEMYFHLFAKSKEERRQAYNNEGLKRLAKDLINLSVGSDCAFASNIIESLGSEKISRMSIIERRVLADFFSREMRTQLLNAFGMVDEVVEAEKNSKI